MSRHVWMDKIAETARANASEDPAPSRPEEDVPFRTTRKVLPLRASSAG